MFNHIIPAGVNVIDIKVPSVKYGDWDDDETLTNSDRRYYAEIGMEALNEGKNLCLDYTGHMVYEIPDDEHAEYRRRSARMHFEAILDGVA